MGHLEFLQVVTQTFLSASCYTLDALDFYTSSVSCSLNVSLLQTMHLRVRCWIPPSLPPLFLSLPLSFPLSIFCIICLYSLTFCIISHSLPPPSLFLSFFLSLSYIYLSVLSRYLFYVCLISVAHDTRACCRSRATLFRASPSATRLKCSSQP